LNVNQKYYILVGTFLDYGTESTEKEFCLTPFKGDIFACYFAQQSNKSLFPHALGSYAVRKKELAVKT
jgi:hypothetical protein